MKTPGRKKPGLNVLTFERPHPEPPDQLSDSEKAIFRDIVNTRPPDYFTKETIPLLVNMVRALDASDRLSDMLNSATVDAIVKRDGTTALAQLLGMREKQARLAVSIATRLRLTPQSRYTPERAAAAARATPSLPKPWLTAGS